MDQRVKLIVGAVAVVLILVIITIVVFLVSASKQKSQVENDALNSLNKLKISPTPVQGAITPDTQTDNVNLPSTDGMTTYTGSNFTLKHPNSWGLLTCTNSQNFEMDPVNQTSLRGVICDYALKPMTVLVSSNKLSCSGETVTLGTHSVVKNKRVDGSNVDYRWCVNLQNGTSFDITHRVSPAEDRASSKEDYSTQIEEIIKSLTPSTQAS